MYVYFYIYVGMSYAENAIFEQGIVFIFIFASRKANNNLNFRKL